MESWIYSTRPGAAFYRGWSSLTESRVHALAVAALPSGVRRILEVSTGPGRLHLELRRRFPAALVAGVDLSPAMLAATARLLRRSSRAGVGRGQLIRADALHLPVRDAVFELVICTYMLDLLPDARIAAAIREFARVLRAGGLLIVAAMDGRQPPGVAAVFRWSASHWPWISGGCRPIDLGSRFDYAQWELCTHERVGQSGFGSELLIVRLKARSIPPGSQYEARELRHSEHPDAPI